MINIINYIFFILKLILKLKEIDFYKELKVLQVIENNCYVVAKSYISYIREGGKLYSMYWFLNVQGDRFEPET